MPSLPGCDERYLFQDTYHELVEYLINAQTDPNNKQRLTEAVNDLTKNVPLSGERINRIRFRDNFDKFIVNVRGFLLVKWNAVKE